MGAIWSMVPKRLMDDDDFLECGEGSALLLLELYILCDGYGLVPVGPRWLKRRTNVDDPEKAVTQLLAGSFIKAYTVNGRKYASIIGYEHDIPAQFSRKRGKPQYPPPSWPGPWETQHATLGHPKDALRADQGQTKGTLGADQGQTRGVPGADQGRHIEREIEIIDREREKGAKTMPDQDLMGEAF